MGSGSWRKRLATQAPARSVQQRDAASPAVRLNGIRRTYGDVVAIDKLDLDINKGEFFTLLGPSGSGKTTTLRVIAGFERSDEGHVELAGVDVTRVPPFERDVNTVFQDYALFPHMTVEENVEYGLRVKGLGRSDRRNKVQEVLERVRLPNVGARKPVQLSGGQRQRVALARAIVNSPSVLLLDEPLGALDLKLRQEMQVFLKALQRDLGITFIYVTHDQEEALTMSDRIAVFNEGRVEQLGSPGGRVRASSDRVRRRLRRRVEHPRARLAGRSRSVPRRFTCVTTTAVPVSPVSCAPWCTSGWSPVTSSTSIQAASSSSFAKTSRRRLNRRSRSEASVSGWNGSRSTPTKSPRREPSRETNQKRPRARRGHRRGAVHPGGRNEQRQRPPNVDREG